MRTRIISIGFLALSGIVDDIALTVKRGGMKIKPAKIARGKAPDFGVASEPSFAKDWLRPEEDAAWSVYQSAEVSAG